MIRSLLLVAMACGWLAGPAPAQSATSLLRQALGAEDRQPRVGRQRVEVFVSEQPVTSEVQVAADGRGRSKRVHLSGPSRGLEVVTEGGWEWRKAAGSQTWVQSVSLAHGDSGLEEADASLISSNYEVEVGSGTSIAGRRTQRLTLRPKQSGNPSRVLWIDAETSLPLQAELRNHQGHLLSRVGYTQVKFAAPSAAEVSVPAGSRRVRETAPGALTRARSLADLEKQLGRPILKPGWLPAGYRANGWFLRTCRDSGQTPVTTFSDGLNTITVMETAGRGGGSGQGNQRRRRRGRPDCQIQSSRAQVTVWITIAGHEAVLVADHDRDSLRRMAESLAE